MATRRGRRRQQASQASAVDHRQPCAKVPSYHLLSDDQLEQIHDKSMQILEQAGIAFYDDEACEILKDSGVTVDDERIAYFDRDMVAAYLAEAPSQFVWSARNPEKDVVIGGAYACFAPVAGPPFVTDIERGRRPSSHEDLINFIKLAHECPYLHTTGSETVVPSDVPITKRHLEVMYSHLTLTDKPVMGVYHTGMIAEDSLAMAKLAFGEEALAAKHYLHCIVNVSSPRRLDDRMLSLLIAFARHNQIVDVTPFILSGAMGPVSILGTLAQLNAETLAGIVFAQIINPGTPCIYGSFQSVIDLQSGAPVMGAPESQLALYASGQLARHYGLPFRAAGNYASAKLSDAQAAYESAISIGPSMLSQPNFILHAAGWLESGLCAGYEKFMLDHETLGMYTRFLKGISWDEDEWAMEAIMHEVPPGGHHLGTSHTLRHFKDAFYRAELFDYDAGETWLANGAEDAAQRANRKYKEVLDSYQAPELDAGIKEALRDYIEKRQREITPAMIVG